MNWFQWLWLKLFPKPAEGQRCVLCDGPMDADRVGVMRYTALNYENDVESHTIHICGMCAYLMREFEIARSES